MYEEIWMMLRQRGAAARMLRLLLPAAPRACCASACIALIIIASTTPAPYAPRYGYAARAPAPSPYASAVFIHAKSAHHHRLHASVTPRATRALRRATN